MTNTATWQTGAGKVTANNDLDRVGNSAFRRARMESPPVVCGDYQLVIPAKAGIQLSFLLNAKERGSTWIPAFAGRRTWAPQPHVRAETRQLNPP
jgi:hypothetical protein